jgi:malate/lactate dehydrogenase
VQGYLPKDDGLKKALTGADIVVIPAGIPRTYSVRDSLSSTSDTFQASPA